MLAVSKYCQRVESPMIREDLFVSAMTTRWKQLGNCPSPKLTAVWRQLCSTLNEQAQATDSKWRVVQPATGTGKSQGLALYSAMHKDQPQVAILIVVRLVNQANDMAALINELAGQEIARTRHSKSPLSAADMAETQVLVITHRAYELSLDSYTRGDEESFDNLMTYDFCFGGKRQLVVIDESLDIVRQYQVELDSLARLLGNIPHELRTDPEHKAALKYLDSLLETLESISDDEDFSERLVSMKAESLPESLSLHDFRAECNRLPWDELILGYHSPKERKRFSERADQLLESCQALLDQWRYYSKKGKMHTLNTSSLVVPEGVQGAVILDATASQNLLYLLFSGKAEIKPVVEARSYRNVNLHVAWISGVGKTKMIKRARNRVPQLMSDLSKRIPAQSRAFLCCHKDLEPLIAQYKTPFALQTGHWGAIDGLNDYQFCDTFVCFGLPYRDRICSSNTYFACKGPQSDEWFRQKEKRSDHGFEDIRKAIEHQQLAVDVIQALNRIRIRRVVDEHGNCEKSDCYLVLGRDEASKRLLDSIRRAMPGINIKEWPLGMDEANGRQTEKRNYFRSEFGESLCKFFEGQQTGEWPAP